MAELQSTDCRRLLHAVTELSTVHDLDGLMEVVRRVARDLSGADGVTFVLREADRCYYAEENAIEPLWKGRRFPIESCISGWCMLHSQAAVIEDIYADPRIPKEAYRNTFVKSLIMVPVPRENPIAAIGAYWSEKRLPSDAEVELIRALADATAVALTKVQLYEELLAARKAAENRLTEIGALYQQAQREMGERRQAEDRFRIVVEAAPSAMILLNREGRITLVNSLVEQMFQYTRDELLNQPIELLIPERFRGLHVTYREGFFANPSARPMGVGRDLFGLRKDKSEFPVEIGLNPFMIEETVCVLGSIVDITERKAAERVLRESEARNRHIIESALDAVVTLDGRGRVLGWNPQAERIFRCSAALALGESFALRFVAPSSREQVEKAISLGSASGILNRRLELNAARLDGTEFPVEFAITMTKSGRDIELTVFVRDITIQRTSDLQLREYRRGLERLVEERTHELVASQERLRQSERLAAMGALATGIAHEINNPVGAMMLTAQNAIDEMTELEMSDEVRSLIQRTCGKVISNAKRCGLIVKGVLQFSKAQRSTRSPCAINSLITASFQLLADSMDLKHVAMTTNFENELPLLEVNRIEMEQVFVNLFKNACENAGRNVAVAVTTAIVREGIRITVADDGPGMSEDNKLRAFDPFFTTRQQVGGSGLGLSIVHGIVTGYGGSVEIESELGRGTKVIIVLPTDLAKSKEQQALSS